MVSVKIVRHPLILFINVCNNNYFRLGCDNTNINLRFTSCCFFIIFMYLGSYTSSNKNDYKKFLK